MLYRGFSIRVEMVRMSTEFEVANEIAYCEAREWSNQRIQYEIDYLEGLIEFWIEQYGSECLLSPLDRDIKDSRDHIAVLQEFMKERDE